MTIFTVAIVVALGIVTLYETETLIPGIYADQQEQQFVLMAMMELITIAAIPAAVRLFKFKQVKQSLVEGKEKALLRWGTLRLMMLAVPMILNTLLYYLFMSTTFGYMGIIVLLCMVFVYPGLGRCYYEVASDDNKE